MPIIREYSTPTEKGRCQHTAVVAVGPRQRQAERRAVDIHDEVALRPRHAAVRQVRARRGASFMDGRHLLTVVRCYVCRAAQMRDGAER